MKQTTLKIGLTCALGAAIGVFIGLKFSSNWGFAISILTGALVGYLMWEIKEIPGAIKKAYAYSFISNKNNLPLKKKFWRYQGMIISVGSYISFSIALAGGFTGLVYSQSFLLFYIAGAIGGWLIALIGGLLIILSQKDTGVNSTKKWQFHQKKIVVIFITIFNGTPRLLVSSL
jgi:hypothetical protein